MRKVEKIIDTIIRHSCNITQSDVVYIYWFGPKNSFFDCILEKLQNMNVMYILKMDSNENLNEVLKGLSIEKTAEMAERESAIIKECTVYISFISDEVRIKNELSKNYLMYQKHYKKTIRDTRLKYCRSLGLKLPTENIAKSANMKREDFEKFYYNACCVDYASMEESNLKLRDRLAKCGEVRLMAPSTDLSFTKCGIPAIILNGKINLPDGEIYTAPNKHSVNGFIQFNTSSLQGGYRFNGIRLVFNDGKIVESECNNNEVLNTIINSDEGSRYIGEFAIGINEAIKRPIGIILFDEKIKGSIHLAIGQSYKNAYNGNNSSVHWDLVLNMNKEYGGGKIYFDKELVFKDGKWLI